MVRQATDLPQGGQLPPLPLELHETLAPTKRVIIMKRENNEYD
jgi:hypothetical protein